MRESSKLHIVGLEELDQQLCGDPSNPDHVNKAWFFMYCYKVLLCPKRYSHDWGACPYAHNNESARRRDPQRYNYSSCICPNTGKGECPHGVQCRYAHTLFEYWLHPARFRTQMCKAGANCKRALCFFAHHPAELRQPERVGLLAQSAAAQLAATAAAALGADSAVACPGLQVPAGTGVPHGELAPALAAGLVLNTNVLPLAPSASNLAAAGNDSSSSNVSTATCQQSSSPTAYTDYTGEFGAPNAVRNIGLITSLPLGTAPVASSGLLVAQMPGSMQATLLGNRYAEAAAGPVTANVSAGLVTSMPQLQELLQHRQQQQLVAGMAAMNLAHTPVLMDQLQPSAVINRLGSHGSAVSPGVMSGVNLAPVAASTAAAAPVYASIMQGVAAPAYAQLATAQVGLVQQAGFAPTVNGVVPMQQQVYQQQQDVYQLAGPGMQYTWM